jgi:hypothetical protein
METVAFPRSVRCTPYFYTHAREGVPLVRGSGCVLTVRIERLFVVYIVLELVIHYNIDY